MSQRPEWLDEEAAEEAIHERLRHWPGKPFRIFPGAAMPVRFMEPNLPYLEMPVFEIGIVWVTETECRIAETHADAFYTAKLRGIETIAVFRRDQLGEFFDEPFTIYPNRAKPNEGSPEGERSSDDRSGSVSEEPGDIPVSESEAE